MNNHDQHANAPELSAMPLDGLIQLFEQTQRVMQNQAAKSVDIALVVRNWLFGWYIVEFEQGGQERTELYGKKLINILSTRLSQLAISGMSPTNLRKFREFYQCYEKIQQTVSVTSLDDPKKIQQTVSVTSLDDPKKIQQTVSVTSLDDPKKIQQTVSVCLLYTSPSPRDRG